MSGLPVLSENASGCPLHHWKHRRPATGDRVDEDRLVAVDRRGIAEPGAHRIVMRLAVDLIVAQRRVRPADEHRKVPAFLPGAGTDAVAGPAFDGEVTGLEVEEQVVVAGSVQSRLVLPMPDLPKITPLMPRFSARR